jgi:hypothetical protein
MGAITKMVKQKALDLYIDAYNSVTTLPKSCFDYVADPKAKKIALNYVEEIIQKRAKKQDIFWLLVKGEIKNINSTLDKKQTIQCINILIEQLCDNYENDLINLDNLGKQKIKLEKKLKEINETQTAEFTKID